MSDLISRQAAINKAYLLDLSDTGNDIKIRVIDASDIEQLPSAEPEIVRCKDCEYFHRRQTMFGKEYTECERAFTTSQPRENDFCSWGEKRR